MTEKIYCFMSRSLICDELLTIDDNGFVVRGKIFKSVYCTKMYYAFKNYRFWCNVSERKSLFYLLEL